MDNCQIPSAEMLRFYYFPPIFISIFLAVFVLFSNYQNKLNRVFVSSTFFLIVWLILGYLNWQKTDNFQYLLWVDRATLIIILTLPTFLYFCYLFPKGEDIKFATKVLIFIPVIPFLVLMPTRYNIERIISNCSSQPGLLYKFLPFLIVFYFGLIMLELFKKSREKSNDTKSIKLIFLGLVLGGTFATFTNVIMFWFGNVEFERFSPYSLVVFTCFSSYAIIKYQFLNIKILLTQSFVVLIWLLISSQFLFIKSVTNRILTAITLSISIIFGLMLIKSVKSEIRKKEELMEMTDKLAQAYSKLKQLDRAKSEFVSIASHQLRTPLTAIKGFISLLLDGTYGKISRKTQTVLEKVYLSNERLINLVEDLLNISRIESGKMSFNFQTNDLNELVRDTVETMRFAVKNKNLYLDYAPPQEPVKPFVFDKDKLREVLNNLIDNAIKYTKKGGVTVRIRQYRDGSQTFDFAKPAIKAAKSGKKVSLKGKPKEEEYDMVQVVVSDTGVGITPGEEKYIFEKFQRGKDISKVHTEGVGLGLFVAQKIVEAHNGKIWAESAGIDRGSRFYVQLRRDFVPPVKEAAPATVAGLPAALPALAKEKDPVS